MLFLKTGRWAKRISYNAEIGGCFVKVRLQGLCPIRLIKEMRKYHPNLLYLFVGVNQSDEIHKSEKDKILRFFLTIWLLVKNMTNMTEQKVNMDAIDKEFANNYSYYKNINKIKDSGELNEFMKSSFQDNRQKELYAIIFNLFLIENRQEKSMTIKDMKMFCYIKSYVDVIDKILNNDYFGTNYIVKQ